MKRVGLLLTVSVMVLALLPAGLAHAKPQPVLQIKTNHSFAGTPGTGAYDGYLKAWVGVIDLDDDGYDDGSIVWWIHLPTMFCAGPDPAATPCPTTGHYSMMTEIYDTSGALVLSTWEHGTTTWSNFTWRANGVVTYAGGAFAGWDGRRVHEAGSFWFSASTPPFAGESTFRLN
jgi:hypothetical protein